MALAVYDALGKVVGARLVLGRGERRVWIGRRSTKQSRKKDCAELGLEVVWFFDNLRMMCTLWYCRFQLLLKTYSDAPLRSLAWILITLDAGSIKLQSTRKKLYLSHCSWNARKPCWNPLKSKVARMASEISLSLHAQKIFSFRRRKWQPTKTWNETLLQRGATRICLEGGGPITDSRVETRVG
jgi:hypothetical protein